MSIFDEKTDLEKRWDVEEAEDEIKNPYSTSENFMDGSEAEVEEVFMKSPLSDKDLPLVLITDNNRVFIGGLINLMGDGIILDHPMSYVEMSDPANPGRVNISIQKVFHGLSVPDSMWFKHDSLNMLHSSESTSVRIAAMYNNVYTEIQAALAGITTPTTTDLRSYSRKNI